MKSSDKRNFRRFLLALGFCLAAFAVVLFLPKTAFAKVYKVKSASDWHNISKYKGGTFKVTKNIKLTSKKQYLTITKNKKYTIDLNGYKVSTTYAGVELRTVCPLSVRAGTVTIKSSKKNKGVLYSTETAAIIVSGKGKLYVKSGSIVDDAVEFRSDLTSAIMLSGNAKAYIQGNSKIQSIGNGIAVDGNAKLYVTGNPYIRAGANNYTGQFMHYGNGIVVTSRTATLSLKGGSIGTKAEPDASLGSVVGTYTYAMSANYPVLDMYGKVLKTAKGYKYVDANGNTVSIKGDNLDSIYPGLLESLGYGEKRLTTAVLSSDGYYTIYVVKKK